MQPSSVQELAKRVVANVERVIVGKHREVELVLVGMPRNMDGSYGPAALKVREFVAVLNETIGIPIKIWDERLTSVQANRFLIEANVRREKRKGKVDKTAAAILLQSYLDALTN